MKLVHVFGAFIWIGGVLFMSGIVKPILEYYQKEEHFDAKVGNTIAQLEYRLIGMNWMALGSILISGLMIAAIAPNFQWFNFETMYRLALHGKTLIFIGVIVTNFMLSKSYKKLRTLGDASVEGMGTDPMIERKIIQLRRANTWLAFGLIILIAML